MAVKNRSNCCCPSHAALGCWCLVATFFCLEHLPSLASGSRMLEKSLLHETARLPSSPDQAKDGGYSKWNNGIRSTLDQRKTEEVEAPLVGSNLHPLNAEATRLLQQSSPVHKKQVPISSRRSLSALPHSPQSGEKAHSPAFGAYDLEEPTPPPYYGSTQESTTVSTSVRIPAHMDELMSMDYTPVHRKPPINNEIPYFPAHYKPTELSPSGN